MFYVIIKFLVGIVIYYVVGGVYQLDVGDEYCQDLQWWDVW